MTEPLVPSDIDLRDFAFMPIDARRLLTSDTWIEASDDPKLGHILISLWLECWHQVPAASLPDNDIVLARLAMCDKSTWATYKARAMTSFVLCTDGRFYHPVVAEKALEAWERKQRQRAKTRAATESRTSRQRDVQRDDIVTSTPRQNSSQRDVHQGTVDSRQEKKEKHSCASGDARYPVDFEKFWAAYPRKLSKTDALKAWKKLKPSEHLVETILRAVSRAKTSEQWLEAGGKFIPYPATWLNGGRWEDEVQGAAVRSIFEGAR